MNDRMNTKMLLSSFSDIMCYAFIKASFSDIICYEVFCIENYAESYL